MTTHQPRFEDGHSLAATQSMDIEKNSKYANSESGIDHRKETKAAERRLLRKQDMVIMPFAVLLYLSAYLDRGNMGNARLQGLQAQALDNSDSNYSIALACFFITYITCSIPGTLLAKQVDPAKSISIGAVIWSIAASAQAGAVNPAGVYTCRLFIGIGEAMFGQAMALHLSFWYTKQDLAKRVGFFISAGALAGAFGGLIAFGVSSIKNTLIPQWRILFLIEGIPSLVLAACAYLFMPNRPETSKFLTEDERTLALTRLNRSSFVDSQNGVEWAGVKRCLTDWKTYVVSISYSCMNLTLASVSGFLPTIIKDGFGKTAADAQLFTVPPYAVALVFMILLTTYSDAKQARGFPIACVFAIGIIGWSILLSIPASKITESQYSARYFACICVVTAGYTNIPLIISWQASNTGSQSQRATSLGMLNTLGQCLSLAASFLFPSNEGPTFIKGCAINLAFQCLGACIALAMTFYYKYENKRRDKLEGPPVVGETLEVLEFHDRAKGFRYTA